MTVAHRFPLADPQTMPLDATGRLDADISCRACGYNLRGSSPSDTCPECGTSVSVSVSGDLLRFSDPRWIRRLASGATLLLVVLALYGLSIVLGVGITTVADAAGAADAAEPVASAINGVVGIAILICGVVGIIRLTSPEPRVDPHARGLSARAMTRWGILGGYFGMILFAVAVAITEAVWFAVPALICGLLTIAGSIAFFYLLRNLARRLPDDGLAKQSMIVMWGFIVTYAGTILLMVGAVIAFGAFAGTGAGSTGLGIIGISLASVGCVAAAAILVFLVWLVVLLVGFRRRLGEAADAAQDHWARSIPHTAGFSV